MSVPGLRSGSGHNPHTRMPAGAPGADMPSAHTGTKAISTHRKVRTRGRVMGTPGKIPADVYANVIRARQRASVNAAKTMKQV